jgi:hypothetical protein
MTVRGCCYGKSPKRCCVFFLVFWRPFWKWPKFLKFWRCILAPLMMTYHYVKFYVSIIMHLEVININFPIRFSSNPHPLWTPKNMTLTPFTTKLKTLDQLETYIYNSTKFHESSISSKFDMWVDNDVPNWFPTLKNFYRSPFSKWPPQYRTNSTLSDIIKIWYVGR